MSAQSESSRSDPHPATQQPNARQVGLPASSVSHLVDQFAAAWKAGRLQAVDEFFADHPSILDDPEIGVRLVYEEFCLRQEQGLTVSPASVLDRFPQWRSKLALVLDCHELVQSRDDISKCPVAGERFGEFQLLQELGRGIDGRVFLATQPLLSDRPVVVKMTSCNGNESLSLARLQHSSIVPLYLTQDYVENNLRVLCMPYLGGTSLAEILEMLADVPVARRSGRDLVDRLDQVHARMAVTVPFDGPALRFLAHAPYVQAVCWIGACLASALQYAHGRGLLHQDLKPSNVLLAGDGQPMLLDFHLARELQRCNAGQIDGIGGTPGYMSPEQEIAMAAVRAGRPVPVAMDGRSDIFALGLLLYELLVGALPGDRSDLSRVPLRKFNPSIPRSVDRIVRKCLNTEPERRFPDASTLEGELRQTLIEPARHEPRNHASFRLNQFAATRLSGLALSALLVVVCVTLGYYLAQLGNWSRTNAGNSASVGRGMALTERSRLANQLHKVVDQLRFLDATQQPPVMELRELEAGCQAIWKQRGKIMRRARDPVNEQVDSRIRVDLLDLAILWADLHVRLASEAENNQARRDALRVLAQAETEFGHSIVLEHERQVYAAGLGYDRVTRESRKNGVTLAAHTCWEHYAIGRSLLRKDRPEAAIARVSRFGRAGSSIVLAKLLHGAVCLSARPVRSGAGGLLRLCRARSRQTTVSGQSSDCLSCTRP